MGLMVFLIEYFLSEKDRGEKASRNNEGHYEHRM